MLSWLALRGRCRTCKARLGCDTRWWNWRWGGCGHTPPGRHSLLLRTGLRDSPTYAWFALAAGGLFLWILVGLAVLDAENLWLAGSAHFPWHFSGRCAGDDRSSLTPIMHLAAVFHSSSTCVPEVIPFWFLGAVIPCGADPGHPMALSDTSRPGRTWNRRRETDGHAGRVAGHEGRCWICFAIGVAISLFVRFCSMHIPAARAGDHQAGT